MSAQKQNKVLDVTPEELTTIADQEVMKTESRFSDSELRDITSFEDAAALLASKGIDVVFADQQLGNGFAILDDKSKLVGVQIFLIEWNFYEGEFGPFVAAMLAAKFPGTVGLAKYILNDGSTGIYQQLRNYTDQKERQRGMMVKNGLRKSVYDTVDEATGKTKESTTYYLDTSA